MQSLRTVTSFISVHRARDRLVTWRSLCMTSMADGIATQHVNFLKRMECPQNDLFVENFRFSNIPLLLQLCILRYNTLLRCLFLVSRIFSSVFCVRESLGLRFYFQQLPLPSSLWKRDETKYLEDCHEILRCGKVCVFTQENANQNVYFIPLYDWLHLQDGKETHLLASCGNTF